MVRGKIKIIPKRVVRQNFSIARQTQTPIFKFLKNAKRQNAKIGQK